MLSFDWFFRRPRTAHPNFAATEQMVLVETETAPSEGSEKEGGFEEKSRDCRDQLYEVVREVMTRSGVLSASYKFKVLSPDRHTSSYLVMIDLSGVATGSAFRPADTEAKIVQRAMSLCSITVGAVYWRLPFAPSVGQIPDVQAGRAANSTGMVPADNIAMIQPATSLQ